MSLVNKTGVQSLYQKSSYALGRLLCIEGIPAFFLLSNSGVAPPRPGFLHEDEGSNTRQSAHPVLQLWDLLALGVPLCILYNAQPGVEPLQVDCSIAGMESNFFGNKWYTKHATAVFIMGLKQLAELGELQAQSEMFTVSELFSNNTNGFVKVVSIVIYLLERLPEPRFFVPRPSSLSSSLGSMISYPTAVSRLSYVSIDSLTCPIDMLPDGPTDDGPFRRKLIQHTLDAERRYIAGLEVTHDYARELVRQNVVDADTVHRLFPGLDQLLDFGRRFLIQVEVIAQREWEDQRWGLLFTKNEDGFAVYEAYCSNYTDASKLMLAQEGKLTNMAHILNPKTELPMLLIKPLEKIHKYHLQILELLKRASKETYPHYHELEQGYQVAKRIAERTNEAVKKAENSKTARALEARVVDWKGYNLHTFGELLLEDFFIVTKNKVDRKVGKAGKSGSIFKRQQSIKPTEISSPEVAAGATKTTPLLLKGRIFLSNTTKTVVDKTGHTMQVWWRGDDDLEFMTLHCLSEERLTKWETSINQIIKENATRRANERAARQLNRDLSTTLRYIGTLPPYSSSQSLPPYSGPPASGQTIPPEARRVRPPIRQREVYEQPHARSESADTSPKHPPAKTQSSITPFQNGTDAAERQVLESGGLVRIKVHYKTDLFQIIVPRDTVFNDLMSKVAYKVRLCHGGEHGDTLLRVKYRDEDGDMIPLALDEDVQIAFDEAKTSGGGVELWVL